MKDTKHFYKLLESKGLKIVRKRKHLIWKRPDGFIFVTPNSPSCSRNNKNLLRELKRAEREFLETKSLVRVEAMGA